MPLTARRVIGIAAQLVIVAAILAGAYWAFLNRQGLIDWFKLMNYRPSANIVALADATTMVGEGRNMFYVSNPQVQPADTFNTSCSNTGEQSIVLGCYVRQQIFVYNVTDTRLNGVKEVTAAHEMLHAAYERMGVNEKIKVNGWLQAQLEKISDPRLHELISLYNAQEPGELLNEMHSILGTEYGNLSPELEQYYKKYFSDRSKVVAMAAGYESVFSQSKTLIASYDTQLSTLKTSIDANYAQLDARKSQLESEANQLEAVRTSDPEAYNQAVPIYNSHVRTFNNLVAETRDLIAKYNDLVSRRNSEVVAQTDLYHSLDSTYQVVPTN